jgi:hypothetical protein
MPAIVLRILFSSWNKRQLNGEERFQNGAVHRPRHLTSIRLRFASSDPNYSRLMSRPLAMMNVQPDPQDFVF